MRQYQKNAGSTFATSLMADMAFTYDPAVEEPALTAAKKCRETEGCTGFVFDQPDEAGDWLQFTLLTTSGASLRPHHGSTAFTL